MLVARSKVYSSLLPWLTVTGGILLFALAASKADYSVVRANLPVWLGATLLLIVLLFVLPIRNLKASWKEIHLSNGMLIFAMQPTTKAVSYDLGKLASWKLKGPAGRYNDSRCLYLSFTINGIIKKVAVPENEYNYDYGNYDQYGSLDKLIEYLEKNYRHKAEHIIYQ
jgi:hypothetical protein